MDFERKHYIYIMLAIILSIIAISTEISTNDLNNKYNKTDETDYLETPRIYYTSGSTNNFLSMNSGSVLAWQINNSVTSNKIELQITKTKLYNDLDMNNYNITNCLNCGSGTDNLSWQSEKVNKSGDNISYLDFNSSTSTNIIQALGTTSRIMDFGTGAITFRSGLSLFSRTYTSAINLTSTQATSRFLLNMTNGLCLDGCGVSALAQLIDTRGVTTVGKFAFSKVNDSNNQTKVQFFVRASTADSSAGTVAFEATPNNFTVPIHNGTGIRYLCVYPDGSYFPSTTACDLI